MKLIQTLLVIATLAAPLRAQASGEVALRSAIETETVKGDIKGALRQYAEVAAKYAKKQAFYNQIYVNNFALESFTIQQLRMQRCAFSHVSLSH